MNKGYFGIGVFHPKTEYNIGTLWRSADIFGASFIFTIGRRYKEQATDTTKAHLNIPLFHYLTFDAFYSNIPHDCRLIGVELDNNSVSISQFQHPNRAIYLLGAEDHGLSETVIKKCHNLVQIPGKSCLNVAVAGSIVLYDRINKLLLI